jgi:NTE family protein
VEIAPKAEPGGVYEALAEAGIHPDWVAGISIGAINAAIIAGNPPESRVDRLRDFWTQVTSTAPWDWTGNPFLDARNDNARNVLNQMSAGLAATCGANGFFSARPLLPWLNAGGTTEATSFYDTSALKSTLERLIDFDRINGGTTRFSAGAVNVTTGNFVYFDNSTHTIRPAHIMASGALPPGFSRGGDRGRALLGRRPGSEYAAAVGNRLGYAAGHAGVQVDLWSAKGQVPSNLPEVITRQKKIQNSSRTRASTDQFKRIQRLRRALTALLGRLPEEHGVWGDLPDGQAVSAQILRSGSAFEDDS